MTAETRLDSALRERRYNNALSSRACRGISKLNSMRDVSTCARHDRSSKQLQRFSFAASNLVHRALLRRFIGTPSKDFGAMPEPFPGEMIVGDFDNDFGIDRFPFAGALGAPPAWATGRVAGKAGRFA